MWAINLLRVLRHKVVFNNNLINLVYFISRHIECVKCTIQQLILVTKRLILIDCNMRGIDNGDYQDVTCITDYNISSITTLYDCETMVYYAINNSINTHTIIVVGCIDILLTFKGDGYFNVIIIECKDIIIEPQRGANIKLELVSCVDVLIRHDEGDNTDEKKIAPPVIKIRESSDNKSIINDEGLDIDIQKMTDEELNQVKSYVYKETLNDVKYINKN